MERQVKKATWHPIPTFTGKVGAGLLAAWLVMLSVPHLVQAAPGDLDPIFGTGGKVTTEFGGNVDTAHALVLQPGGPGGEGDGLRHRLLG